MTEIIPKGWKKVKLGEVAEIKGGKRLPKGKSLVKYPTQHPYIRPLNIKNNKIIIDALLYVPDDVFKEISRYIVEENDIILSIVGTICLCSIIPKELNLASLSENFAKINNLDKKLLDYKFLFYYLISDRGQEEIYIRSVGSTQPKLPLYNIKDIPILLPPLSEQRVIASVLSSFDDKIELLHRQNQTLEKMAETLFRQWFIEEAKEDWEKVKLGEVVEIFDNKRIPLSKMEREKMKDGDILYPYYGATKVVDYINDYIFDGEYLLIGEDGTVRTDEGYPVLQLVKGKFWVNNHTHVLKAKPPYTNYFIFIYLKRKNIDKYITGAVQPKITQTNLKSIEIPKFPIDLVQKFNKTISPFFEKINENHSQIRTLEGLRDILLPKLMSGEIRVKY